MYSLKAAPLKSNLEVDFDHSCSLETRCGKHFSCPPKHLYFQFVCVPQSSHLLILLLFFVYPFSPKSLFQHKVEGVSKAILIFLPVDCMGWKTVKDFFSSLQPSVLIYGLSLSTSTFHPISIMVIFPQYRFNALIPLFYFSQECYSGSPVLFSCQLPMVPYFSTKEGEI